MSNLSATDFLEKIDRLTNTSRLSWPNEEDMSGAVTAIKRLQDTYNIKTSDMAEGRLDQLSGKTFGGSLSAKECYVIGNQLFVNGENLHAVEWLKYSIKKLGKEGDNPTIKRVEVYQSLVNTFKALKELKKAFIYTNLILDLSPEDEEASKNYRIFKGELKKELMNERYHSLCRNEVQLNER